MPILRPSTRTQRWLWGCAAGLTIISAIFFFAIQVIQQTRYSMSTQAQINRLYEEDIIGTRGGKYLLMEITFSAALPDGTSAIIHHPARIYNLSYYNSFAVGDSIPLRYDPHNPRDIFFPYDANPYDITTRFFLPLCLLMAGVYFLFNFLWG